MEWSTSSSGGTERGSNMFWEVDLRGKGDNTSTKELDMMMV